MPNLDLCYIPCGVLAFAGILLHMQFLRNLRTIDQGKLYSGNIALVYIILFPIVFFYAPIVAKRKAKYFTWYGRKDAGLKLMYFFLLFGIYTFYLWFLYYGIGVCYYVLVGGQNRVVQNFKNLLLFQGIFACLPLGILESMAVIKYGVTDVSAPVINSLAFVIILVAVFCDNCFSNSTYRIRIFYITRNGFLFLDTMVQIILV